MKAAQEIRFGRPRRASANQLRISAGAANACGSEEVAARVQGGGAAQDERDARRIHAAAQGGAIRERRPWSWRQEETGSFVSRSVRAESAATAGIHTEADGGDRETSKGQNHHGEKAEVKKKEKRENACRPKSVLGPEAARQSEAPKPAQENIGAEKRAAKRKAILKKLKVYPVKFHGKTVYVTIPPKERNPRKRSAPQVESACARCAANHRSQGSFAEGLAAIPANGGEAHGQAHAHRPTLAQPFMLEIRGPDGDILVFTSLYDFLRRMYVQEWTADEFRFEELQIEVNGAPLLPKSQGNA